MVAVFVLPLAGCFSEGGKTAENSRYLRVHIRADSNNAADQDVKYKVKDALTAYLTPVLSVCEDKAAAEQAVGARLSELETVCADVLSANGFAYGAKARLAEEFFPTRSYGDMTLAEGDYDALIVELGSGKGDNWWCMVYPPMCFTGGEANGSENIVYKSRILEIIEQFKKKYL